jgi:glycosyltransferase involved in cell wall biosynthesis
VTTLDIMLPFYGDPALMRLTVESILAQSSPEWQLTVVDDGYPDDSIPGYFADLGDSRVRYERNEKNLGANGNYRKCVGLADRELVVVMGADDIMLPNYVETVLDAHRQFPRAAVIQPGVQVIDEHGTVVKTLVDTAKQRLYMPKVNGRQEFTGEPIAASLLRSNWLYFPSLCFRRDAMVEVGFRDGLNVVQDLALVIDLICRGDSLVVDSQLCFSYRRHSASDSSWRALEGTRFIEERDYFLSAAAQVRGLGWNRAARAAELHLSSRLNAATYLPAALRKRQMSGVRNLSRHAFGPARPSSPADR